MKKTPFFSTSVASTGKIALLLLLLLTALGMVGCAGMGRVVSVEDRILFGEQEKGRGEFKDGGLTINYNYDLVGRNMKLDGQLYYLRGYDSLDVRLLFLDADGTILHRNLVYSSGYRLSRSWKSERDFQKTLVVPDGAEGISFSHIARPRFSRP